jgi:hypothetical protein
MVSHHHQWLTTAQMQGYKYGLTDTMRQQMPHLGQNGYETAAYLEQIHL